MADAGLTERTPQYWFVGATYNETEDQTDRFVHEGIWENGYEDKYLAEVRSVRSGDRIAIKSTYTRKWNLPFETRGNAASVMAIKAIGTVVSNVGDGRTLRVSWTRVDPPREWYFYTNQRTIWRVQPGEPYPDALIAFAFEGVPQDLDRFRSDPYWKERFGETAPNEQRFGWTTFYEEVADKLVRFRDKREALLDRTRQIAATVGGLGTLQQDHYPGGSKGFIRDICPFTTMGLFNRGTTDANRRAIAGDLANFLGVQAAVPESFEGVPLLNNMSSWFFTREIYRDPAAIEANWDLLEIAIRFADSERATGRDEFIRGFDKASAYRAVGWKLTFGLYWIRPWTFLSLDENSRSYIETKLGIDIPLRGAKRRCSGSDYLALIDTIEPRFQEQSYPVHSFPELSYAAWMYDRAGTVAPDGSDDDDNEDAPDEQAATRLVASEPEPTTRALQPYSIDDIVAEGCFVERARLQGMLARLRLKKNVILQGPPGTGKTWLAKRLGYALMGHRDETKLRAVQFHPNLSYEDFVRGYRPLGNGGLDLSDGVFMQAVRAAQKEPNERVVVVIEEINRGNPAQVFGEMLTLLETDKRTPTEALELSYRARDGERVFVPENLYVIGTMNVADRSLALVDLALRRRFAFIDLQPTLGDLWHHWVTTKCGMTADFAADIERRISVLNEEIAKDPNLGSNFAIGHSYVTPPAGSTLNDIREWFSQVVETEIGPLLDEYWFDSADKARAARARLLEGL